MSTHTHTHNPMVVQHTHTHVNTMQPHTHTHNQINHMNLQQQQPQQLQPQQPQQPQHHNPQQHNPQQHTHSTPALPTHVQHGHPLTVYKQKCDELFPHIAHAQREQFIFRFEQFYHAKWLKDQDPTSNLIFLQRNCQDHRNPYIQYFILAKHGDFITPSNFVFTIPSTSTHSVVQKPILFFTNIYPEIILDFLSKRPELVNIIDPITHACILHQYELDYRVLMFAYQQNRNLIHVRDKHSRTPLHHKNQAQGLVVRATYDFPELCDAVDSHGNTVRAVLGLK